MVQQVCAMCRLMAEVKIMPIVESLNDFGCLSEDFYQDLKKPSVSTRIKWRGLLRKINSNQQRLARMIFVQLIQRVNSEIADELEKISQICCLCGLIDNTSAGDTQDDQIKFMSLQFPKTTHTWEPLRRSKSLDILIEYSCSSLEGKPVDKLQTQADQDHGAGYIKAIYQRSGFRYEDSKKDSLKSKQSTKAPEYHHEQVNPYTDSFSKHDVVSLMKVEKNEASTGDRRSDNDDDDNDDNDDNDDDEDDDGDGDAEVDADADADADAEADAVIVVDQEGYVDAPERLFKSDLIVDTSDGPAGATQQPISSVDAEGSSLEKTPILHGQTVQERVGEVSHIPSEEVCGSDDLQVLASEDQVSQDTSRVLTTHVGRHTQKSSPVQTQTLLPIPARSLVWVFQALLVLTAVVAVMHVLPTGLLLAVIALVCIQIYIRGNG